MCKFILNKINMEIFNDADVQRFVKNKRMVSDKKETPKTDKHPVRFLAYDDDGLLYFEGTVTVNTDDWEDAFDWCQVDSGVTYMRFFDRKTKKYIDAIG